MGLSIRRLKRFLKADNGATSVEYALMASGIFLVILTAVQLLGVGVQDLYQRILDGVKGVASP